MFQTKPVTEFKKNTLFYNFFLKNRAVCEKMSQILVKQGRPQKTIRRTRFAHWVPNATNTHSQYVIFPQQQRLYEPASKLRYTYSALPVLCVSNLVMYFGI